MNLTTLREARSSPYIGPSIPENAKIEVTQQQRLLKKPTALRQVNGATSEENFLTRTMDGGRCSIGSCEADMCKNAAVLFNTGTSSSSSTDLSSLVQFYNESADAEIAEQWMDLYTAQKVQQHQQSGLHSQKRVGGPALSVVDASSTPSAQSMVGGQYYAHNQPPTNSNSGSMRWSSSASATASGAPSGGQKRGGRTKNYSESAENLQHCSQCSSLLSCNSSSTIEAPMSSSGVTKSSTDVKYSINRSMDVLPKCSKENFRLLEKCCSVDFPTQKQIPSARLARSKEMPNIADVDDYD